MTVMQLDADLKGRLDFLIEADKMKTILRRTMLADYSRRENDAEHSWHLALTILTLADYADFSFNMERALEMAVVHDLVEIYAGDTFAYDKKGYQDKENREERAAERLFSMLPQKQGEDFYTLWKEFDASLSNDAKIANAADRIQPFINNAVTLGHTWRLGNVSKSQIDARMNIVRETLPALIPYIDGVVAEGLDKGWIQPD